MDSCTTGQRKIVIMHHLIENFILYKRVPFAIILGLQKLSVMKQVYEILKIILNYYR